MTSRLSESLNKFLFLLLHTNRVVPSLPNFTALFWRNLTSSSFIGSSCNPKLFQSGAAGIQWPAGAVCPLGLWRAGLKVRHIHKLKLSRRTNKIFSSPSRFLAAQRSFRIPWHRAASTGNTLICGNSRKREAALSPSAWVLPLAQPVTAVQAKEKPPGLRGKFFPPSLSAAPHTF